MPRKAEVQEEVKEVQEEVQAEETNTEKPGVNTWIMLHFSVTAKSIKIH